VSFMAVPLAFLWAKPILLLGVEDNIWRRGFQCGETALPEYLRCGNRVDRNNLQA
jgi:hypothetical protein